MQKHRSDGIERSLTNRSRVTNGTRLIEGIDGRTPSARRFRDLIESFSCDLGGTERLTEAERALVKQAASVTIRAEQLQAAIVRGEAVDPDELIRLSNTSRRLLASIRRRVAPKPTLADHLAKRGVAP
jgi:undecaprenyl pyrophosphate synthase